MPLEFIVPGRHAEQCYMKVSLLLLALSLQSDHKTDKSFSPLLTGRLRKGGWSACCWSPFYRAFRRGGYSGVFYRYEVSKWAHSQLSHRIVGRTLDCRVEGRGFDSQSRTNTRGLKITDKWRYCLGPAQMARSSWGSDDHVNWRSRPQYETWN